MKLAYGQTYIDQESGKASVEQDTIQYKIPVHLVGMPGLLTAQWTSFPTSDAEKMGLSGTFT